MSSAGGRVVVGVVAIALVAVLFFVLRDDEGDDGGTASSEPVVTTDQPAAGGQGAEKPDEQNPEKPEEPEEPELATIEVKGGQPVGGVAELEFAKGERIQFVVRSDVADHVHLHGYDVFKDVPAGGEVEFDVPATIEGVFEAELEDRVVPVAEITVNPG